MYTLDGRMESEEEPVCMYTHTHTQGTFHPEATRVIVTVDALAEWERGHTSLTGVPIPRWDLYIIDRWKGSHSPTTSMPNTQTLCK